MGLENGEHAVNPSHYEARPVESADQGSTPLSTMCTSTTLRSRHELQGDALATTSSRSECVMHRWEYTILVDLPSKVDKDRAQIANYHLHPKYYASMSALKYIVLTRDYNLVMIS